ncbi:hypothetical protein P153DRAFT_392231 [Dothidotthia symphoricarpi CBS 119687]|uniref:Uncharacterized protein n=1 Tax=Dothidotthia symphoricarpi CBS 119687 TaxID=1392245 RepID=A0A6A6AUP0_9PLEO|nr:uncharacterized protein P153DRAFT_392231 [Dothidotthia symphoricarpi CBS 119687]KAF2134933.1 hypothetical protein P153DRAFT_392231 [Dothidotthia symphoricarpi CBS 119687]
MVGSLNVVMHAPSAAIQALIAIGPTTVSLTTERCLPNASPHHPSFLRNISLDTVSPSEWNTHVLPYISTLTFDIACNPDVHYLSRILTSPQLPRLHTAITTLSLSGHHWFSGVMLNRHNNPYLTTAAMLPNLQDLTFTMHTAGVTTSVYGERRMVEIERTDPVESRARRTLRVENVVQRYGIDAVFACAALRKVRVDYVESELTLEHCRHGDPYGVIVELQAYLVSGFAQRGRTVRVDVRRA